VHFKTSDFFALNAQPGEQYSLIYDYTYARSSFKKVFLLTAYVTSFFVAIPPSKREEWGIQMSGLIVSGGYLITLVYPIEPYTDLGPPFFVRVEHYEKVLETNFTKVFEKVPEESSPRHEGKELLIVWRRN
jgi:methyl halide transferase